MFDDSRYATEKEFISNLTRHRYGSLDKTGGVPLKADDNVLYSDDGDSHTLIFGNTGTKKTRNFVIPSVYTMAAAGENMIIADPKGEIYRFTSGYLTHLGYDLKVVNLRFPERGSMWNPLALPFYYYTHDDVDRAVEMVTDLAMQLKTTIHSEKDLYWENQAVDLFVGIVLALFDCSNDESTVNMESIEYIRMKIEIEDPDDESTMGFWNFCRMFKEGTLIAYKLASVYSLRRVEKTLSCVLSTFDIMLRAFFINRKLMDMTSRSEIDFDLLLKPKTAIFLIMPDEKTTYHFLVSVFVKQCYEYIIMKAQNFKGNSLSTRLNFVLDEFSNFPKIADMSAMISAARSRNIRFVLIVQSKQQLIKLYGDDSETIKSNCKNWIFLPCREKDLLNEISELCGTVFIQGRGYRPLINNMQLQNLKIGWEYSEALILRPQCMPYIAKIMDFSMYPASEYEEIELTARKFPEAVVFDPVDYYEWFINKLSEEDDEASEELEDLFDDDYHEKPFDTDFHQDGLKGFYTKKSGYSGDGDDDDDSTES